MAHDDHTLPSHPTPPRGVSVAAVGIFLTLLFLPGLYHLARRHPDVELVPVYLENLNRILPKGEVILVPLLAAVTFGPSIRLEPGEPKLEFLERARAAVASLEAAHP